MSYDVIVVGLGGMGSAALAHLAAAGRRVLGLEQFSPAHAMGSSHGQSRIIRKAYFEDPAYVPLLVRAYELWSDLEQRTGRKVYLNTGGLQVGYQGSEVLEGSIHSAREHGLSHEVLDAAEIHRRFPVVHPAPDEMALYEADAGILFPEESILAHLQFAVSAGAEARFGVQVTGWNATPGGGVQVLTSEGAVEAERLVVCAGAWTERLLPGLGVPLQVERNVMHWFSPAARAEEFASGRLPIFIVQRRGVPVFYGFPALPGQGLKAAFHHSGRYTAPDQVERNVAPAEVRELQEALSGLMPDAAGTVLGSAVCMYTNTPDEHFVIGTLPEMPQVIVAGGFSGHGFKFCSVMGEILTDLAVNGATNHPVALFSPQRFRR